MAFRVIFFVLLVLTKQISYSQLNLTEEEISWLIDHPVIKVANEDDWPPFDYSKNGKALGLTISYTDLIAKKLGIRFEYINGLKWEELLKRGKNKEIDLMPCLWYAKEREEYFWYTKPYISNPVVIVTNKKNKSIAEIEDLKSRKVAFIDGYVIKDQLLEAFPEIQSVTVNSPLEALLLVNIGSADAYIDSLGMVSYQIEKNLLAGLQIAGKLEMEGIENINNLYMGVRKDWPIFHGIVQKALDSISGDEKLSLHNRWLMKVDSDSKGKFMVLPSEQDFLDELSEIRLGVEGNMAPISYFSNTGEMRGIAGDYVKEFEGKILKSIQVSKVTNPLNSLKSKDVDVTVTIQQKNHSGIVFSEPFLSLPLVAVTTKKSPLVTDLSVLENQKIALAYGSGLAKKIKDNLPSAKVSIFTGITEALNAVKQGTVDAYIGGMATSNYYIQKFSEEQFKFANISDMSISYSLAMREDSSELISIFDRFLSSIPSDIKKDKEHRWLNIEVEQNFDLSHYWQELTVFMVMIVAIIGGFVFWNRSLSKEIAERMKVEASLVKAREVAEQSDQAKSDFLAVMSHEIRTPLNGIIGMSQILEESDLNPEQKKQCKVIVESGESLLTIINDILDFSKIAAGKMQLEKLPFNLEELFSSVVHLYEQMAEEKGLKLTYEINLEEHELDYIGDVVRLRQVLLNLVNNALKFTVKGKVSVIAQGLDEKGRLKLEVRDTGIGISEENLSKLFTKFSQADSSTTRKFGGTGLGLAICRNLVELMGGEITCESKLGEGSCFKIILKLNKTKLDRRVKTEPGIQIKNLELNILLVEDNVVNQKIAEKLLNNFGCTVVIAENGLKAIETLQSFKPDLVFMDCHMPEMDGYEATRRIRQDSNLQSLPIVALTANATPADREKCMEAGMNDFLAKPFNKDMFTKILYKYSQKSC